MFYTANRNHSGKTLNKALHTARLLYCLVALSLMPFSLMAKEPVSLATLNWEPYIGETLPENGFVHAVVDAAFKRAGLKLDAEFYPWARALNLATEGKVVGLFPEYYDESRLDDFIFSDPIPGGPVGFYKRVDNDIQFAVDPQTNPHKAFEAMRERRFGVVRGYINTTSFDEADYLYKEAATSDETNLRKLYYRRIDMIFIDAFVAEHILKTKYPEYIAELEFMRPPLENKLLYIAFSKAHKDSQRIRQAFNVGLAAIYLDGTLRRIQEKYGFITAEEEASLPGVEP